MKIQSYEEFHRLSIPDRGDEGGMKLIIIRFKHTSVAFTPFFMMSTTSMSFLATSIYPSCPMHLSTAQAEAIAPPIIITDNH